MEQNPIFSLLPSEIFSILPSALTLQNGQTQSINLPAVADELFERPDHFWGLTLKGLSKFLQLDFSVNMNMIIFKIGTWI